MIWEWQAWGWVTAISLAAEIAEFIVIPVDSHVNIIHRCIVINIVHHSLVDSCDDPIPSLLESSRRRLDFIRDDVLY
jgi:hypothetical protein